MNNANRGFLVGNDFFVSSSNLTSTTIEINNGNETRVIGNRFDIRFDTAFGNVVYRPIVFRIDNVRQAIVNNNLFKLTDVSALSTTSTGSRISGLTAVYVTAGFDTTSTISNNVFDYGGFDLGIETAVNNGVIDTNVISTRVQANIFTGINKPIFTFTARAAPGNIFRNNLCFTNTDPCPGIDGNFDSAPLFVDNVDYQLGPGSPAQ